MFRMDCIVSVCACLCEYVGNIKCFCFFNCVTSPHTHTKHFILTIDCENLDKCLIVRDPSHTFYCRQPRAASRASDWKWIFGWFQKLRCESDWVRKRKIPKKNWANEIGISFVFYIDWLRNFVPDYRKLKQKHRKCYSQI